MLIAPVQRFLVVCLCPFCVSKPLAGREEVSWQSSSFLFPSFRCKANKNGEPTDLSKQFMKLRDNDVVGPLIPQPNRLNTIPVESPWIIEAPVICQNYSAAIISEALAQQGYAIQSIFPGAPAGLRQEDSLMEDADMLCSYDDDDFDFDIPSHEIEDGKIDFYQEMMPLCKEWISLLQGSGGTSQLEEALHTLRTSIAKEQARVAISYHGEAGLPGRIISSNLPTCTDRVTHGQRGQKRKRKQCVNRK
jgi:hypothetical protein